MPYKDNVELTKKVCDYAHNHKPYVTVEAELGQVAGAEGTGLNNDGSVACVTDVEQAKDFIEKTLCNSLAIACGTKHGAYKYSKNEPGRIRFDVLKKFSDQLPDVPVVIHGSSAVPVNLINQINSYGGSMGNAVGISDDEIQKAVSFTVCKINIDTDLRLAVTGSLRQFFFDNPGEFEPMS